MRGRFVARPRRGSRIFSLEGPRFGITLIEVLQLGAHTGHGSLSSRKSNVLQHFREIMDHSLAPDYASRVRGEATSLFTAFLPVRAVGAVMLVDLSRFVGGQASPLLGLGVLPRRLATHRPFQTTAVASSPEANARGRSLAWNPRVAMRLWNEAKLIYAPSAEVEAHLHDALLGQSRTDRRIVRAYSIAVSINCLPQL